jgi:hypothetical protein
MGSGVRIESSFDFLSDEFGCIFLIDGEVFTGFGSYSPKVSWVE